MNNTPCSPDYILEPKEGLLQYCPGHEHAQEIAEDLRAIAEARRTTHVLIKNVCENHKDPVQRWKEVMERSRGQRHGHSMGDMLDGCFDELLEAETEVKNMIGDIIQFPKK